MSVALERRDQHLWLRYMIDVPEKAIDWPATVEPLRTDGLWQSTCFEAFLKAEQQDGYVEHNFALSSQWAAYAFDGYRSEMRAFEVGTAPTIWLEGASSWFAMEVKAQLPHGAHDQEIDVALSAVIEETDGTKSYWALRHPPGAPDFHHPDCFALTLEAPDPA